MSAPLPSGIVTLTTDFGLADAYVGVLHGVLLRDAPALRVVDVTHAVAAQDVVAGAFHLRHAWPYFAAGTVHLAVVDPGVGTARRLLVARHAGHLFVAPDNGLLALALGDGELSAAAAAGHVWALAPPRGAVSATFHGRDVLAPAAAQLARGVAPERLGTPLGDPVLLRQAPPVDDGRRVLAEVVHVDRFGNLITGFAPGDAADPASWRVRVGDREVPWVRTYADVAPGTPLALLDSYGLLEVAVRDGDAAATFGLGRGARVTLEWLRCEPRLL